MTRRVIRKRVALLRPLDPGGSEASPQTRVVMAGGESSGPSLAVDRVNCQNDGNLGRNGMRSSTSGKKDAALTTTECLASLDFRLGFAQISSCGAKLRRRCEESTAEILCEHVLIDTRTQSDVDAPRGAAAARPLGQAPRLACATASSWRPWASGGIKRCDVAS